MFNNKNITFKIINTSLLKNYFFYTDPTVLSPQNDNQTFGPVLSTDSDFESGKDKYRITNLHASTNAPAIAICDGTICVQPDNQGSFSIILKPDYQPNFDFPYIKYFIYKGVKKTSLVKVGANEIEYDLTIPFLKTIRDDVDHWNKPDNDITKSDEILGLAYKSPFPYTVDTNTIDIFADNQPIDNLFYYPKPDFQLPSVKAGEKIGVFEDASFGFEIVLERLGYEPKISLARTLLNHIKVDSITDSLNQVNTWQVDDADYFLHCHAKEECLNYIDPSAFYGSFCGSKVYYKKATDLSKRIKCNSPEEIYDDILDKVKFVNRNKVYIDIRNDYNYSYNYYKNYGNLIKVSFDESLDEDVLPEAYHNINLWPIFSTTSNNTTNNFIKARLALPNGDNRHPIIQRTGYIRSKENKRKMIFEIEKKTFTYAKSFSFHCPLANNQTISLYRQFNYSHLYNENQENLESQSLFPKSDFPFDNKIFVFNTIKNPLILKQLNTIRFHNTKVLQKRHKYAVGQMYYAHDDINIILYINNIKPKKQLFSLESNTSRKNDTSIDAIRSLYEKDELTSLNSIQITKGTFTTDVLIEKKSQIINLLKSNVLDDGFIYIIDKTVYVSVLTDIQSANFINSNLTTFKIVSLQHLIDDDNQKYTSIKIAPQGLTVNGTKIKTVTAVTTIEIIANDHI